MNGKTTEKLVFEGSKKTPKWWDSIVMDYFRYSGMHGLKYIADPRRHLTEKFFWTSSFIVALLAAVYLIREVWTRYEKTPVIVSFRAKDIELHEIPFPGITICNMNKIPKNYVDNLARSAKHSGKDGAHARDQLRHVKTLCDSSGSFAKTQGFASPRGRIKLQENNSDQTITTKIYDVLLNSTPPCDEMIRLCLWGNQKYNCGDLFKTVVTAVGKCCAFNQIPISLLYSDSLLASWNVYRNQDDVIEARQLQEKEKLEEAENRDWERWKFLIEAGSTRPRFQQTPGTSSGLSLLMDPNSDSYFCSTSDSKGFNIFMGTPVDEPRMRQLGKVIGLGREVFIEVVPTITFADPDIKQFHPEKRQCIFPDELKLKFYRSYTQKNCFQECKSKEVTKQCSCVPYYAVRFLNTSVCSSNVESIEYKCYNKVSKNIDSKHRQLCSHCSVLCADLAYKSKITYARLQNSSKLWRDHFNESAVPYWAMNEMAVVHIYFKLDTFYARIRRELFGRTDLIANMGNLLTLCLGFSVLSGVEILYFFTARIFWNYIFSRYKADTNNSTDVKKSISSFKKQLPEAFLCNWKKYNPVLSYGDYFVLQDLQCSTLFKSSKTIHKQGNKNQVEVFMNPC
ncbi:unnamed protein product [Allacma fusca]|uniref:Pickpocket protein 28 n=1 Tax=Allacma fusca TaxID=39272 RepID=A0A8J2P4H9_9HEXA|nr:unnamed protein product [Allacma fusca]